MEVKISYSGYGSRENHCAASAQVQQYVSSILPVPLADGGSDCAEQRLANVRSDVQAELVILA